MATAPARKAPPPSDAAADKLARAIDSRIALALAPLLARLTTLEMRAVERAPADPFADPDSVASKSARALASREGDLAFERNMRRFLDGAKQAAQER